MGIAERKYTDEQRQAVIHARVERRLTGAVVSALAAKGELENVAGERLPAFEIAKDYVYGLGAQEERRRSGARTSALVSQPPEDAIEELRRRLVEVLDRESLRLVGSSRQYPKRALDVEQARKVGRAVRELAAMPAPGERGVQPGRTAQGAPAGEGTSKRSTMAGQLIAAAQGSATAQAGQLPSDIGEAMAESIDGGAATGADGGADERLDGGDAAPGSRAAAALASIRVSDISKRSVEHSST